MLVDVGRRRLNGRCPAVVGEMEARSGWTSPTQRETAVRVAEPRRPAARRERVDCRPVAEEVVAGVAGSAEASRAARKSVAFLDPRDPSTRAAEMPASSQNGQLSDDCHCDDEMQSGVGNSSCLLRRH